MLSRTDLMRMIGGQNQVPPNDTYMPDWSFTTRRSEILGSFKEDGEQQAHHACTCKTPECPWHFTNSITWLDPAYFKMWMDHRLGNILQSIPKPEAESEDDVSVRMRDLRDTLTMYREQWAYMGVDQIRADPRYRAYEVGFNSKVLELITNALSFRVPTY